MATKLLLISLYIIIMIVNGFKSKKDAKDADSFYTGGRNIGALRSASAYITTFFSAVMFTLTGSLGFAYGLSIVWIGIFNALITGWFAWRFLAERTRKLAEEVGAFTAPQMVEKRLNSQFLRVFLAAIILIFLIPYTASVYQGISYIFQMLFPIPYIYCIIGLALVTAIYVFIGGNSAMMSNSIVQGLLILACVIVYIILFFNNQYIGSIKEGFISLSSLSNGKSLTSLFGGVNFLTVFSTVVMTSIGGCATPQLFNKFITVKKSDIKTSGIITMICCLIIAGGMYFLGGFSKIFFEKGFLAMPDSTDKITGMIMHLLTNDFFFTLIFIMLLASSMSTLASLVLTASSALTEDILPLMNKKSTVTSTTKLKLARVFSTFFILFSALISIIPNPIISLMSVSWGMIASVMIGPYFYSIFSKKTNKLPAIISSVYGFLCMGIGVLVFGMNNATKVACVSILSTLFVIAVTALVFDNVKSTVVELE